jgi:glycosyltransferase involved in cell wall biosynthesis
MLAFTIIVPVYNTRGTQLRECLQSLEAQDYPEVGFVLVDDGSDNPETLAVLQEYAARPRFTVQNLQSNLGLSAARNAALEQVDADYILFLDSDDYLLNSSAVSEMAELLETSHADVLSYEYIEFFDERKRPSCRTGKLPRDRVLGLPPEVALANLLKSPKCAFSAVAHTKAVRTDFLRTHSIGFPKGEKRVGEDIYYTAAIIRHAESYDRYNKAVVAFRRTGVSLSRNPVTYAKTIGEYAKVFRTIFSETPSPKENPLLLDFLSSPYAFWMRKLAAVGLRNIDFWEKDDDLEFMRSCAFVLRYASRPSVRLVYLSSRLLGFEITVQLLGIYFCIHRRHTLGIGKK